MSQGWRVAANMTQDGAADGGHLVHDETGLSFQPHGFDRLTGVEAQSLDLLELESIDIAPRTFNPFDGGLRKRLRLRFVDGREMLFVVNRVRKVGQMIAEASQALGGSPRLNL